MNIGKRIRIGKFLQFSDVFDEDAKSLNYYLQDIPKSILLKSASHFLGHFTDNSTITDDTIVFLRNFFQHKNDSLFDHVVLVIRNMQRSSILQEITILNPVSSLIFFEYANEHGVDMVVPEDFDTQKFEINLFKAYLTISELLDKKQTEGFEKLRTLTVNERMRKVLLMQSLPDIDLLNHSEIEVFICQLLKADWLFTFLENEQKCSPLIQKLFKELKVDEKATIFKHLINLGIYCLNNVTQGVEGRICIEVPKDNLFDSSCAFLDMLKLNYINAQEDFKNLRASPLYEESRGVYCVIYKLFLLEKIYKGWYFKLNQINDLLDSEQKIKEFRSFYGQYFTENFLIEKVLSGICNPKAIQISGNRIRQMLPQIKGEPDYYIRDWNHIFLFETKETFLKATVKTSYSYDEIESDLKEKLYYKVKEKGQLSSKAVKQIIENVRKTILKLQPFDEFNKANRSHIYPVLILHDESFNATGLNYIVNEWFQDELRILRDEGINVNRVRPLIIITIDTLILLQDLMQRKKIGFQELLETYAKTHLSMSKNNDNPIRKDSYTSFSVFALNFARGKNLIPLPNIEKFHSAALNLVFGYS